MRCEPDAGVPGGGGPGSHEDSDRGALRVRLRQGVCGPPWLLVRAWAAGPAAPVCRVSCWCFRGERYAWEGYDSLFVPNGSLPAAAVQEWCAVDRLRARVMRRYEVLRG